jgi:hypothetical protein
VGKFEILYKYSKIFDLQKETKVDGFRSKQIYKQKYLRSALIPDYLKCQNVNGSLNFCKSFLPAVYRFWIHHDKKQFAGVV